MLAVYHTDILERNNTYCHIRIERYSDRHFDCSATRPIVLTTGSQLEGPSQIRPDPEQGHPGHCKFKVADLKPRFENLFFDDVWISIVSLSLLLLSPSSSCSYSRPLCPSGACLVCLV